MCAHCLEHSHIFRKRGIAFTGVGSCVNYLKSLLEFSTTLFWILSYNLLTPGPLAYVAVGLLSVTLGTISVYLLYPTCAEFTN